MQQIHMFQISLPILIAIMLFLGFKAKDWIGKALSDDKGPSSFRLFGFLLIITVMICEIFHTVKKEQFDTQHLLYILLAILVLLGIVKFSQITDFIRGKSSDNSINQSQSQTQTA